MKPAIVLFVLFIICGSVLGQKQFNDGYKIRAKGRRLIVTFQGKPHWLDATEQIDAEKVTEIEILFAGRRENFTYLVVDVSGQSRNKQNDRQCGAGIESNLIWIKLDSEWKISGINSVRYESCRSSVSSDEGYKITDKTLSIELNDFRENRRINLSYNADEPEKGFQIERKNLDDN